MELNIEIPNKLLFLLTDKIRYKVAYGGRGGAKSHAFARALIVRSMERKVRVLCTRELQNSIGQSVHKLLKDVIGVYNLDRYFKITEATITCNITGSEFHFKGIRNNINDIKSIEGIDICWVEEAQSVSKKSWEVLIPTIRKEGSEIWVSFNPEFEDDETYQRFVVNPPDKCISVKINYNDNPWFPGVLRQEMEYCKRVNYDAYLNIWEGECKRNSDAQIFKDKWVVEAFDTPPMSELYQHRFFYGADWGFATDPTALVRSFMRNRCLYIDYEAFGHGVELDEIPQLFDSIPDARRWPIKADNSRPETISHISAKGFNISPATKWSGSVEDGVEYLRSFEKIIIHERCPNIAREFKMYSYKVDKNTEEILPIIVDAWNHGIDALRYSIDDYITKGVSILDVI